MYLVTHGDHGTSVSDKINQKTKKVANTRFFLRIFFPAHFDHWKLRKSLLVVVVVGGKNDSLEAEKKFVVVVVGVVGGGGW